MALTFVIDEGRVYGARYYTAQPHCEYGETIPWYTMEDWIEEMFGSQSKNGVFTPGARWYANSSRFWFRNKKDLEWFILRWQ